MLCLMDIVMALEAKCLKVAAPVCKVVAFSLGSARLDRHDVMDASGKNHIALRLATLTQRTLVDDFFPEHSPLTAVHYLHIQLRMCHILVSSSSSSFVRFTCLWNPSQSVLVSTHVVDFLSFVSSIISFQKTFNAFRQLLPNKPFKVKG